MDPRWTKKDPKWTQSGPKVDPKWTFKGLELDPGPVLIQYTLDQKEHSVLLQTRIPEVTQSGFPLLDKVIHVISFCT